MKLVRGFTLIELMLTLAVLAVLAAIAVPGFNRMIQSNRITATTNEFVGAFNAARSEAVRRGTPVTICRRGIPSSCATGAGSWADGWVVQANDGTVLRSHGAIERATDMTSAPPRIVYTGDGRRRSSNPITFKLQPSDCRSGAPLIRRIRVNAVGRVYTETDTC